MADNYSEEVAIKVDNLSKVFKLPHEKVTSIKSAFINFYRRKSTYEMHHALKNVNFEIKKGEFFGIVGRNGSGKSTLLKLLAGIYTPDSGRITVNGKLVPFIELGVGFDMDLSGRDNVYLNGALLGFSRKEMKEMYEDIVKFAELERFMDQKLKNFSSGMQIRLAFSIAIRAKGDILLIDEVLAVGDEAFQRKCFSYFKQLKSAGKTVVFVSHDMSSIREFCDRGVLIDYGEVKFAGDAEKVAQKYMQIFATAQAKDQQPSRGTARSGSGDVKTIEAKYTFQKNRVVIRSKAKAYKNVDSLQYGVHITSYNGEEIAAMNNRMLKLPDARNIKAGDIIEFEWQIANIFNQGRYSLTLTFADGNGNKLDHYPEAVKFEIKRPERSSTWVLPPIEVSYKT